MKKHIRNAACLILGLLGFNASPALAANDMFLCIDGVDGESTDEKFPNCIDVLAWSWGMTQSGTMHIGGGGGTGKVSVQDISLTKWLDKSTPELLLRTANGKHFPTAGLYVRKSGCLECVPEPYYTLELTDVLISSVSQGGSGGEDRLTENVTLNFAKVEWCYSTTDIKGGLGTPACKGWDIQANIAQ